MGPFEYTAKNLAGSSVADKWIVFARLLEMMKHFEHVPAIQTQPGDIERAALAANRIQALITGTTKNPRETLLEGLEALGINPGALRSILKP